MQTSIYLKTSRILSLFMRLINGEIINKKNEAARFNVNEKSIQRDLSDIKNHLAESGHDGSNCELKFVREKNGYCLVNCTASYMRGADILALAKILLESRSLCQDEMDALLNKLLRQASSEDAALITDMVRNEQFYFEQVQHGKCLTDSIWQLSCALHTRRLVQISYQKENEEQTVSRVVEPQGIIFSEYYFYLVAYIHNTQYDYPAVYRIDRIEEFKILDERYSIAESRRFEEGQFRKRVQFMKSGPLLKVQFKFWGNSLDAVLDRLPTARVIESDAGVSILEAEVFGQGIKMWLLSQAEYLEVLEPKEFRAEMKRTIEKMAENYRQ